MGVMPDQEAPTRRSAPLDDVSKAIIEQLQQDGRRPYAWIGEADALAELDEIEYVVITAGGFDILVEAVRESDQHLLEVLSEKIRTIAGVRSTETFVYLKLRKQTYSWGVR